MVFSSTEFLFLFLPALIILYYLPCFRTRHFRNFILLLFSIGFYAWGEPVFVFIMLISVLLNWAIGLLIARSTLRKKLWLSAAILLDVSLLAVFKYATFLSGNLALILKDDRFSIHIALPIGISFFTFQMMSYVFDVYYQRSPAQNNPAYVALYICLFPQLIAGPIVRYNLIEAEIDHREDTLPNVLAGTERFIYGLGKKVLLSNYTGFIADRIFSADARSLATAWLGAIAYTLQIYFDFSGYSDMAIGLGKMFGFSFPENFDYPYTAGTITEFWRRWHISLSTWFRDYVYIPLGGNRVSKGYLVRNMFIVWILTGIWHGANWTFLCWGFLYFTLLIAEKLTGFPKRLGSFSHVYTMLSVTFLWVIFRSDSLGSAAVYITSMLGISCRGIVDEEFFTLFRNCIFVLFFSVILSGPVYPKILKRLSPTKGKDMIRAILCPAIFVLSLIQIGASAYSPFIYFNF